MRLTNDQTTDFSSRELFRYLGSIELPDYVKQAELDDVELRHKYGSAAFADEIGKTFPIISPASVYVSNAYFFHKRAALNREWGNEYTEAVGQRIIKAAELFEISADINRYNEEAAAGNAKDYNTEVVYSTKVANEDFNFYPVKTKDDLIKAAEHFVANIEKFPYAWRFEIAENFVKKAKAYAVEELPDLLCKYAGLFYPNVIDVANEIWRRSTKLANANDQKKYASLVGGLNEAKEIKDFRKIADELYYTEKLAGLYEDKYTKSVLGDPVDRIFTLSIDKVAELLDVVEMGGNRYHVCDLRKVSSDIYKEAFGVEIDANKEEQLREVLPTMPRSDVALFEELSGVKPVA